MRYMTMLTTFHFHWECLIFQLFKKLDSFWFKNYKPFSVLIDFNWVSANHFYFLSVSIQIVSKRNRQITSSPTKMKLFQTIRGYFAIMGFEPAQQSKNHSLNLADLVILTILVQFSVAITAFIFCDAKSFKEVADSFYPAASAISATLNLITIICNAPNLFKLIDGYENAIQSSKNRVLYLWISVSLHSNSI